jgi:hypothetical protein
MRAISNGIKYEVKGDTMTIIIDLAANPGARSKSGKNHMVATTGPAAAVDGGILKPGAKLGLNLYEPIG